MSLFLHATRLVQLTVNGHRLTSDHISWPTNLIRWASWSDKISGIEGRTSQQGTHPGAGTEDSRVKERLACLFDRILDGLNIVRSHGLYAPPSFFIVYAHNDRKNPTDEDAGAGLVHELIGLFRKAGCRARSDREPVLSMTETTEADQEASWDILVNQFCLLPEKLSRNPVDKVIIVASKVLFGHCNDTGGKQYMNTLKKALLATPFEIEQTEVEAKIRKVVDEHQHPQSGFHHVLTEIALVTTRVLNDGNPHTIVPIMLWNAKFKELRDILDGTIPSTRHYHSPRESSHMMDPKSQSLHRLFFNVLEDVYGGYDEGRRYIFKLLQDMYKKGVQDLENSPGGRDMPLVEYRRILNDEIFEEIARESRRQPLDVKKQMAYRTEDAQREGTVPYPTPPMFLSQRQMDYQSGDSEQEAAGSGPFVPHPKPPMSLSERQKQYLTLLTFDGMDSQARVEPIQGSLSWVPQNPSYQKWMGERSGMLGVLDKPGSGKITILRDIVARSQAEFETTHQHKQLTLSFFFFRAGTDMQRSRVGMFSALHQLLRQVPMAGHEFWNSMEDVRVTTFQRNTMAQEPEWLESLRTWFLYSLVTASRFSRILIVVDALDEANDGVGTETAREVLADLRLINREMRCIQNADVRICFSSRHHPTIVVNNGYAV